MNTPHTERSEINAKAMELVDLLVHSTIKDQTVVRMVLAALDVLLCTDWI